LRFPSAGAPIGLRDILAALSASDTAPLRRDLARLLDVRTAGLAGSGCAALYVMLKALAERSGRNEVLIPAYSTPVLLLPIRKAGLRPVMADADLETFQMDTAHAAELADENTLAVVPVHLFGIPCDLEGARRAAHDGGATLIEDAASALGATLGGRMAGTLADAGFYSFHRGKHVSSYAGGAWATNDPGLADAFARAEATLRRPAFPERAAMFARIAAVALVVRPWCYTLLHPLLAPLKDTKPHKDFLCVAYTAVQAGAVRSLLRRLDAIVAARNERAYRAREILADTDAVTLPRVPAGTRPAFSHCPLMMPDSPTRERAVASALDAGVECTRLNEKTVQAAYHLSPDAYRGGPCPRAEALAERLLLIPCHPLIPMAKVEQAAEIVRKAASGE